MFQLIGFCLVAIILIFWSYKRLNGGKDFRLPLIIGIVLYAVSIIGAMAEGSSIIGNIISLILLAGAFVVFSGKAKK